MYVMYRPWNYINICNMYSYHTTIYTHYESVLISLHIYNIIYTYVYILFLIVAIAAQSDVLNARPSPLAPRICACATTSYHYS